MATYLLPCNCGKDIPIEVGQAGGKVVCACGAQHDVPTLRKLRHLPSATQGGAPTARRAWNARKGVVTAGLIVAAVFTAITFWVRLAEPKIAQFEATNYLESVEQRLETPATAWQWWNSYYHPLAERGFPLFQPTNAPLIQHEIAKRRFLQGVLMTCAGICAAVALAAWFWPATGKTRRQEIKDTTRGR